MSDSQMSSLSYEELQEKAKEPGKIHFVSTFTRPGTRLFTVYLEYNQYPPRTTLNEEFEMALLRWPEKDSKLGLLWVVVTIPEADMHLAEAAAKESGMVIKDGTPMIIGGGKTYTFPMQGPSVYSLESNPKSRVYKQESESILESESTAIQKIFKEDEEKHRQELREQGLTEDQIDILFQEINNE